MATSRIFIKGLPPSLDENEFRAHFSKKHIVTDVKLLSHRRMGYVGFKSPAEAQSAVKYFNKSFLHMSRLTIELAKNIPQPQASSQEQPIQGLKRKRIGAEKPASPSRATSEPEHAFAETKEADASVDKGLDKGDDDVVEQASSEARQILPEPVTSSIESLGDQQSNQRVSRNDTDWMRTHTSRLLGLVCDENEFKNESGQAPSSLEDTKIPTNSQSASVESESAKHEASSQDHNALDSSPSQHREETEGQYERQRLFIRNLSYDTNESDLKNLLEGFGELREITIPHDFKNGKTKGFAFAEFEDYRNAHRARSDLDGSTFQGRVLHLLPAAPRRGKSQHNEFDLAKFPIKKRRVTEKKQQASNSTFAWNFMYMNTDAVLSSTAARLGISKSELLDATSSDAAVKQAHAETHTIQEAKQYFQAAGVNLESFSDRSRDGSTLLVKNFKYGVSAEDLKKLFSTNDSLKIQKILAPPAGTIAIIEFANSTQAAAAMREFAYRKVDDSVLFIERGPRNLLFDNSKNKANHDLATKKSYMANAADDGDDDTFTNKTSIFVSNLNFITSQDRLWDQFRSLNGLRSVLVKTRPDPNNEAKRLSMGFGFFEFQTKEQAESALDAINGTVLDSHELQASRSRRKHDAAAEQRQEDQAKRKEEHSSKLIIKNLPFEASRKDLRSLLRSYGQLRALRMPRTINNTTRGYAFAQFKTRQEAENAMEALSNTHLLGRRLILEYAVEEIEDPEKQIEKMQEHVGKQSESVSWRKSIASNRQRLDLQNKVDEV